VPIRVSFVDSVIRIARSLMITTAHDGERDAAEQGSTQWQQIILSDGRPASARRPSRLHSLLTAVEPNGFAGLVDQCTRSVAHLANRLSLPLLQEIRVIQREYPRASMFGVSGLFGLPIADAPPSEATIGRAMAKKHHLHGRILEAAGDQAMLGLLAAEKVKHQLVDALGPVDLYPMAGVRQSFDSYVWYPAPSWFSQFGSEIGIALPPDHESWRIDPPNTAQRLHRVWPNRAR
jgi:hypothetical protein